MVVWEQSVCLYQIELKLRQFREHYQLLLHAKET